MNMTSRFFAPATQLGIGDGWCRAVDEKDKRIHAIHLQHVTALTTWNQTGPTLSAKFKVSLFFCVFNLSLKDICAKPASDLGPCLGCRTVVTRTEGFASTRTSLNHL